MSCPLRVRPAKRADIPDVVRVSRGSVSVEEMARFGTPVSESVVGDAERLISAWVEPNSVGSEEILVAEMDGLVVGCVKIEEREDCIELVDIDVLKEMQGKGIGTHLVQHVEELARCRGKCSVTLGTSRRPDGMPWSSFAWWQSLGYTVTHEEENAWTRSIGEGWREIRMRKDLG